MKDVRNDDCELKDCMKAKVMKNVRDIYMMRTFMLPYGGNFKHDKRFSRSLWRCLACGKDEDDRPIEDQEHVKQCVGYADIRGQCDMFTEVGRMEFHNGVLERR